MSDLQKYIRSIKIYFRGKSRIDYVILFGSSVSRLKPDSDVDLLVGGKIGSRQKIDAALFLEKKIGRKVDVVCVEDAGCVLALEAFAKGLAVVIHDREQLKRDYFRKFYEYEDSIPLHRIRADKAKRELAYG